MQRINISQWVVIYRLFTMGICDVLAEVWQFGQ
jgi:hypothetical protein